MDSKNVIAAIALSTAVIVLYSLFFLPEQSTTKQNLAEKKKIEQNTDTPTLDQKETLVQISREEALKESERILFENQSIIGSISLKGAAIDDLTFKNYKVSLKNEEKITLLGPRNIKDGYLIESGFVTTDKNIDIPNSDSIWSVIGNKILTEQSPVKLSWTNNQGITFEKEISLDNNFLFTINQKVINSTNKKYDFSDIIGNNTKVKAFIKCNGLWYYSGKFGLSWKAYKLVVDRELSSINEPDNQNELSNQSNVDTAQGQNVASNPIILAA